MKLKKLDVKKLGWVGLAMAVVVSFVLFRRKQQGVISLEGTTILGQVGLAREHMRKLYTLTPTTDGGEVRAYLVNCNPSELPEGVIALVERLGVINNVFDVVAKLGEAAEALTPAQLLKLDDEELENALLDGLVHGTLPFVAGRWAVNRPSGEAGELANLRKALETHRAASEK